ncbi:hypothetical protein [Clostridium estertheticum]|nr:hypothetical protein [Clostridium estertheticum]MCB2340227.1 hypothetical protein [Clostridium estertheticum]
MPNELINVSKSELNFLGYIVLAIFLSATNFTLIPFNEVLSAFITDWFHG